MLSITNTLSRRRQILRLISIMMMVALLGVLSTPVPGLAQGGTDPIISLSSADAPACSGDDEASCISASFKADLAHTASYIFDCSGSSIDLPLLEWFLELLGVPLSLFEKLIIPGVPTPLCTLFAQGSTLEITEKTPNGTYSTLVEKSYIGGKHEGAFTVQANYTYEISLIAHGRDFREALQANNLGTFDSFANITYQEIDPNDDLCRNAIPFNLPYSGNLEFSGDHDWQEIQSPVKGTMVLTLDVPDGKDYQLEVWSDDCNAIWVGSSYGPGMDETVEVPVNWGAYHIHVFGKTPDDFNGWYGVSAAFSGDLNDNQWENAAAFDLPFNGNLEYSSDEDWQRINIPDQVVYLVLDVPDGKNYDLELWRDDTKIQLSDSRNNPGIDERILISGPGSYRIHIYGFDPSTDFDASYGVFLDDDVPVILVRDIAEGSVSSNFSELINVNGALYFVADHVLWKSNGSEEGTIKVVGSSFSNPHDLTNLNGKLFFAASPGEDTWMTDGTPAGTRRLNLTYNPGSLSELTAANDMLYFVWRDCGPGSSLCDILMSLSGEISRETVAQHPAIPAYSHLTDVDGTLFYDHADYRSTPTNPPTSPKLYWQLMKLTSADEDPVAVGDIPGDESNSPGNFHAAGGILYFVANDGIHGSKVWRSDGSTIEMVPAVAGDIPQIGSVYGFPQEIADINGHVYFTDGRALWTIDDTGNARGIYCYFLTTSCVGSIERLGQVGDMLWFVHSWEYATTLFRYDGNIVTTVKQYPAITNPLFFPTIDHLTDVGGKLFFVVNDGIHGAELWTSDGTPSGSIMVADIAPGITSSNPDHLTDTNGMLFFTTNDSIHGMELWRTVVDNRRPTAEVNGPYTVDEGSPVTLDASASSDPDGDLLTYEWDLDNDDSFDDAAGVTAVASFPDDGQYPVQVRVTDPAGAQSTDSGTVNVLNVAPTIPNPINTTGKPALINTNLEFSASFNDPGTLDTHTALWDWGDGNTSPGLVDAYNVTGSHAYTKAGLYTVTLSIADDDGGTAAKSHQFVVVVDPKAGFVTGGGWFRYPNKIGLFGFSAHYLTRGTNTPVGNVVFQVPSSRFVFHSMRFDWLVIDDSKAFVQGTGKVNGKGIYSFSLTATDGSPDKIRIKIWNTATGEVIYDNQPGASDTADPNITIQGGSIVIHKVK